jgi:hypothetical protein
MLRHREGAEAAQRQDRAIAERVMGGADDAMAVFNEKAFASMPRGDALLQQAATAGDIAQARLVRQELAEEELASVNEQISELKPKLAAETATRRASRASTVRSQPERELFEQHN